MKTTIKLLTAMLAITIAMSFTACQDNGVTDPIQAPTPEVTEGVTSKATESLETEDTSKPDSNKETYQSILDTYSAKIKEDAPKLVEEFKSEAAKNTRGREGLDTISKDKVSKLAAIPTEGIIKMAKISSKTGSGEYSDYEEWAKKLMDVYVSEAGKITIAYKEAVLR